MNMRVIAFFGIAGFVVTSCGGGQSVNPDEDSGLAGQSAAVPAQNEDDSGNLIWAANFPPSGRFIEKPSSAAADPDSFLRVPRAAATDVVGTGTPESERLQIRKTAVMYEDGKSLFVPGVSASTEEFPVQTITIRMDEEGHESVQGDDGSPPVYTRGSKTTDLTSSDGVLEYSVQATSDGLVYKMSGNAAYVDFQRNFEIGPHFIGWYSHGPDGIRGTADDGLGVGDPGRPGEANAAGCLDDVNDATSDCTNWNHDDVQVTLGLPAAAPNGDYAWYWNVRVPFPDGVESTDENLAAQFDFTWNSDRNDLGSYELWLTNLGRIDRNLEYANNKPNPGDDELRYLSYAAYGLFVFTDNLGSYQKVARTQGLHFGYSAFADADDAKTTDISSPVTATFTGRTIAHRYLHLAGGNARAGDREELRADITLNATIGGSDGGGVTGVISNFEMLGYDGNWHRHAGIVDPDKTERLILAGTAYKDQYTATDEDDPNSDWHASNDDDHYLGYPASIGADGQFKGGVFLQTKTGGTWYEKVDLFDSYVATEMSQFGGTFYGPTGNDLKDLEAAGHWYLRGDARCNNVTGCGGNGNPRERSGGVYGSFGALNSEKEFND